MESEKDRQIETAMIEANEKLDTIVKLMWELAQSPISRRFMRVSVMSILSMISGVPTDDEGNFLKGETVDNNRMTNVEKVVV